MLDLGHNQLTNVPDALGHLEALTDFLYLHDNQLRSLPASLGKLRLLRYLNLSDNAFEVLPEAVAGMCGLVELRAEQNRLASLPNWIGDLGLLRELHLRGNRLTSVPESIGQLRDLRQLDLRGQSGGPPSVCDCQPAAARQARPALGHNVAVARLAGRSRGPRLPRSTGDLFLSAKRLTLQVHRNITTSCLPAARPRRDRSVRRHRCFDQPEPMPPECHLVPAAADLSPHLTGRKSRQRPRRRGARPRHAAHPADAGRPPSGGRKDR